MKHTTRVVAAAGTAAGLVLRRAAADPPIPPEILLRAARDAVTLPEPTFDWNPKLAGDRGQRLHTDVHPLGRGPRS